MNTFIRWGKFNLVGAMGMVVQLGALALFNRRAAGHYLYASAAAIELTLLHNFMWHLHYTWRDRRVDSVVVAPLIRFHLSNGLVSMLGNLLLMRMLVQEARLPVLASNCIAILCCSILNFGLGNSWAFAARDQHKVTHVNEADCVDEFVTPPVTPFAPAPARTTSFIAGSSVTLVRAGLSRRGKEDS